MGRVKAHPGLGRIAARPHGETAVIELQARDPSDAGLDQGRRAHGLEGGRIEFLGQIGEVEQGEGPGHGLLDTAVGVGQQRLEIAGETDQRKPAHGDVAAGRAR